MSQPKLNAISGMKIFFALLSLLFLFSYSLFSQEMSIDGVDITQCGGFLVDDGFSSGNYSNNQNESITICAPAPETIINLYFTISAMGSGDYIEIFDGPNSSAPLIGTYYGTDLQTTDITSTNASGCLTVHFIADGDGVGNFAAEISCGPPCERPFSIINTNQDPNPILICPGEEVTFDGSASTFASGMSMAQVNWVFDDGTTNTTSWPSVSHIFEEPGAYKVQLMLTDNNDCSNNNLTDYIVMVSTYPDFSLLSPDFNLCSGGQEYMGVNFFIPDSTFAQDSLNDWISEPWVDLPNVDFGGSLPIPDVQSECFESELIFTNFDFGATIQSASDLDYFYMNFEHSFMGDLVITFICPDGSSIAVHQQGGSGTFLGEPIDDDLSDESGVGYDYYWAPDATNGTWADNAGATLPSGTYESEQSFDGLIGCPLNGTWTVQVCDMWTSDNGFIFDWSVAFDPSLFGDLLSFTPEYGVDCDSSFWDGPHIVQTSDDCDFILIEIYETGSYDYIYTVTNNFGCTFDTTITVEVYVANNVTAGPDMIFSCNPIELQGGTLGQITSNCSNDGGSFMHCAENFGTWTETYCPDVSDGITQMSVSFNTGSIDACCDFLYIYDGASTGSPLITTLTGNLAGQTIISTSSSGCLTMYFESGGGNSCADGLQEDINYDIGCNNDQSEFVWNWSPSAGLSDPNIANPVVDGIGVDMEYILTGYPVGYPGCGSVDTALVTIDNNLPSVGIDTEISLCPENATINMFDELDGDPATGGIWYDENSNVVDVLFDPAVEPQGVYTYVLDVDGCLLSVQLTINVQYPDIYGTSDLTICQNGSATLQAFSDTDFDNTYTYYWNNNQTGPTIQVNPTQPTQYFVYAIDGANCYSDSIFIDVDVLDPFTLSIVNDSTICPNGTVNAEVLLSTGGDGNYTFTWTVNGNQIGTGAQFLHTPGTEGQYCVTLHDGCETTPVQACMQISEQDPMPLTIWSNQTAGCSPLPVQFEVTTAPELYTSASWNIEDVPSSVYGPEASNVFVQPKKYDVTLTLMSLAGCLFVETFSNYIEVYPDPIAGWVAGPQPTNLENTVITFNNVSQGRNLIYNWEFDGGVNPWSSSELSPVVKYPDDAPGEYEVRLLVTDDRTCTNFLKGTVVISDVLNIYIPNSFTPNNDGINDFWRVEGTDISDKDFMLIVFNRWGDEVFRTSDPLEPWTGSSRGGDFFTQNGVYNYVLKVSATSTSDEREISGTVTVIR
jgi:gliding motility-associated-like protein